MADENDGEQKMSVIEAIALKDSLNRRITYGTCGLNAQQAKELLDGKLDWKEIWKGYSKYYVGELGSVFVQKQWLSWVAIAVSIGLIYLGGNWGFGGFLLIAWVVYQAAKGLGHADGYHAGYSDAHTETMKKMLGITEEEEKDLYERAMEMEIDGGVLDRFEKRHKTAETMPPSPPPSPGPAPEGR